MDYPATVYAMIISPEIAGLPPNFQVTIEALRVTKISNTKAPYVTAWVVDDYVYKSKCHEIAMKVFCDPVWAPGRSSPSLYIFRNKLYQVMTDDEFETICAVTKRIDTIGFTIIGSISNIVDDIQSTVNNFRKSVERMINDCST